MNGASDPYVKLFLTSDVAEFSEPKQSTPKEYTLKPVWGGYFQLPVCDFDVQQLVVEVSRA